MTGRATGWVLAGLVLSLSVGVSDSRAASAPGGPKPWREVKCERYRQAWTEVRKRWGLEGLGQAFIERHDAFLASGCTADADVCPRSPREIEIANILTIAAMNAGTASTFPPFACRK
jgi:hypothetical protein